MTLPCSERAVSLWKSILCCLLFFATECASLLSLRGDFLQSTSQNGSIITSICRSCRLQGLCPFNYAELLRSFFLGFFFFYFNSFSRLLITDSHLRINSCREMHWFACFYFKWAAVFDICRSGLLTSPVSDILSTHGFLDGLDKPQACENSTCRQGGVFACVCVCECH